jgi:hypothetical protein
MRPHEGDDGLVEAVKLGAEEFSAPARGIGIERTHNGRPWALLRIARPRQE